MNSAKRDSTYPRRPVKSRPPLGVKRVSKYTISLPFSWGLIVSLRKFTTSKNRRSKQKRQLVVNINISNIREVTIELTGHKNKKSRPGTTWPISLRPVRAKTLTACALIILGLSSSLFFGTHIQKSADFTIKPSPAKALAAPQVTGKTLPKSTPVSLQIPKIGVNTQLSQVGLQTNGQMEMPWDITVAAWYKYSPTPGELGPSIIVGHLDGANYANMAGVFYRLHELVPGDQFMVTRADGSVATFKVLYLKQVPQNNFPTKEIYGNINYAGIRLITCGGTFDTSTGHYNDNTVVFGALE